MVELRGVMNDMMHFYDNISGFFVCSPSEGVQKTRKNACLRKVGKVQWTVKCGDRYLSWRCSICSPSEGVQKTRKNARLRKVGRVWWTGKCGESQFSWQCCICSPSEGVQKTQENAHLRKVCPDRVGYYGGPRAFRQRKDAGTDISHGRKGTL